MEPTNQVIRLADYKPHPRNYNRHSEAQVKRIQASLRKFGQVRSVVVWRGQFLAGHGVAEAARGLGWESLRADVLPDDYPEHLALAYVAADNELARQGDPDQAQLAAILADSKAADAELLEAIGYSDEEFGQLLEELAVNTQQKHESSEGQDEESPIDRADVPDAVWPSSNDWGVPSLDLNMQALAFDQPHAIWGAGGRKVRMNGTWLFYTEDYRYEALWYDPSPVLNTGAVNAIEPNFSVYRNMPAAVALWQIYRKRWIARWWQSHGLRVFADLNVASNHYELNALGIPQGWRAFATRGYSDRLDELQAEFEQAQRFVGEGVTPLFLVYGGGKAVKAICMERGWLWITETMDEQKGREV